MHPTNTSHGYMALFTFLKALGCAYAESVIDACNYKTSLNYPRANSVTKVL